MKKKIVYEDIDLLSALTTGKEKVLKLKEDEISSIKEKGINLFDFITDIRKNKRGDLLDNSDNINKFNSYMILKILSMNENDVPICNMLSKYTNTLTKEQMYIALLLLIQKDNKFYKYIKENDDDNQQYEDCIIKKFNCSKNEAKQYIDLFGIEWAMLIKNKYEGK